MDIFLLLPALALGLFYVYAKRLLRQLSMFAQIAIISLLLLSLSGLFFHLILPPENPWRALLIYSRDYGTSLLLVCLTFYVAHEHRKHGNLRMMLSRREAQLQQQKAVLHSVIEAVPLPIAWRDKTGLFQGCNQIYADFIGVSRSLLLGQSLSSLLVDTVRRARLKQHEQWDKQAMKEGAVRYESEENNKVLVHHKKAIHGDDGLLGVVSVIYDATELVENRRLVRKQDALNKAFLELTDDIIIILDKQLIINFINPSIGNVSAIDPKSATGFYLSHLEDKCVFFAAIAQQVRDALNQEVPTRQQFSCTTPYCGQEKWFDAQCSPVYVDGNTVEFVFCSIRDVSALMKAQQELAYMNKIIMRSAEMGIEIQGLRRGQHD